MNYYMPTATVNEIDKRAAADHRDRTSMLNKIVSEWLADHPATQPTNGTKPTQKAGVR